MTKFQELCAKYVEWDDARNSYRDRHFALAHTIMNGFGEYVGAPKVYKLPFDQTGRPYIELMAEGANGEHAPAEKTTDAFSFDEDGWLQFAFSLTLERATEIFPKIVTYCRLSARAVDDVVTITTQEGKPEVLFSGRATQPSDFAPLYDRLCDLVTGAFSHRPGSPLPDKDTIGFLLGRG